MADELLGTEATEVQADTAAAPPAPQGEPVLEGLDGLDLRGLAEGLRPTVEAPTTDAVTESDEDDGGEQEAEPEAGEPAQPKTQLTAQQWAEVLRDAPQRINEAPGKLRAEAIRLLRDTDTRNAQAEQAAAFEQGRRYAQRLSEVAETVAQIDEVKASDPAAFVEWQTAYPDRYAAYIKAQAELARSADGARTDQSMQQAIGEKARQVLAPLAAHPDIVEKLASRNYPMTIDGLTALTADVATEIARAEAAPAKARQQAAAESAGKPKPLIVGSGGGKGEITAASLKAMTPEQVLELTSTPEGAAAMERALRRPQVTRGNQ